VARSSRRQQRIVETSRLKYSWNGTRSIGDPAVEIRYAEGVAFDPAALYRAIVNSFMDAGGHKFVVLKQETNRVVWPVDFGAQVA
jgi:5'-nucleotidase